MASSKQVIVSDSGEYLILTTDKAGKISTEKFVAEHGVERKNIAQTIGQQVKAHGAIRAAMLSFLDLVVRNPRMDGFKRAEGSTLDTSGKLPEGMSGAGRDVESLLVREMVEKGELKFSKGANIETEIQNFLSTLRIDKNYCAVKTTVLKYLAFVGKYPTDEKGNLVPVKVMQTLIEQALPVAQKEEVTVFTRLRDIITEVYESENISADEYQRIIDLAGNLAMTAKEGRDEVATKATAVAINTAVAAAGQAAITAAMAKVGEAVV